MILRATTTPGIEDIASTEITAALSAAGYWHEPPQKGAFDIPGLLSTAIDLPVSIDSIAALTNALSRLRSVYHLSVHVAELEWDGSTLDSLVEGVRLADTSLVRAAASFRVSCERAGEHAFRSPDAERAAGTLLFETYDTAVNLEHYQLHVKLDVIGDCALLGFQLTRRKGLDRRYPWQYHPRVSLRTPIAFAMLTLAGYVDRPEVLLDPFCGSGTILLEAASVAGADAPSLHGRDWDATAIDGATRNVEACGFGSIELAKADARDIVDAFGPESVPYIVTNPPFGIRLARGTNFQAFYASFLRSAEQVLAPGGRLVLLVGKRRASFARAFQQTDGLQFVSARTIEMGGVYPSLTVIERT